MSDMSGFTVGEGPVRVTWPRPGVAQVTLHDPERRNAMSEAMTAAWASAVAGLRACADLRCVVVTGAGRAFCAGGDLGWIGARPDASAAQMRERMLPFYRTWLGLRDLEVPVLAAVNGAAVGAGAALVLASDIAYAGESASFSVPFARLGLHPGMGTTYLLPAVVGLPAARDLLLTGRSVGAAEMAELGIVRRVVPDGDLLDAVLAVAEEVVTGAPIAVRLTVAAFADGAPDDLDAALRWESLAQPMTLVTHDLAEGLAAARERRAPIFEGR